MVRQSSFLVTLCLVIFISGSQPTAQTSSPQATITVRTNEGTTLAFDISPDARSIVFDLLGQLWLVPASGGVARPITDAVRDSAEDLDPSFSPDGHRVLFRGERNGRTGLWLVSLEAGSPRQLTQLANPDGYDGNAAWSPDGRTIAFAHTVIPNSPDSRPRSAIMLLDVASGNVRELSIKGLPSPSVSDPVWLGDGKQIAFVTRIAQTERGGRVWTVSIDGAEATPVSGESMQALAPSFSADGQRMAYFAADTSGRMHVWMQEIANGASAAKPPIRLTNHNDVTVTRIRWLPREDALMYSADGRMWKVGTSGGSPVEVPFTATLSFSRPQFAVPPARFAEPGQQQPARGFMGLALSPDGGRIGMLALAKLWIIPVGGTPRAVTDVPFEAAALAWSPDGSEVAWSAGVAGQEDLFTTNVTS